MAVEHIQIRSLVEFVDGTTVILYIIPDDGRMYPTRHGIRHGDLVSIDFEDYEQESRSVFAMPNLDSPGVFTRFFHDDKHDSDSPSGVGFIEDLLASQGIVRSLLNRLTSTDIPQSVRLWIPVLHDIHKAMTTLVVAQLYKVDRGILEKKGCAGCGWPQHAGDGRRCSCRI